MIGYKILREIKYGPLKRYEKQINNLAISLFYDRQYYIIRHDFIDSVLVDGYCYKWDKSAAEDGIRRQNSLMVKNARHGDIVLDIGANFGVRGIPLSRIVKRVISVEPVLCGVLRDNIELNKIRNITALEMGLSNRNGIETIEFQGRENSVPVHPFRWFMEYAGGRVDYLICDCEGPEWFIDIKDCAGIRAFWIEFHLRHSNYKQDRAKYLEWLDWWNGRNYNVKIEPNSLGPKIFKEAYHVYAWPK